MTASLQQPPRTRQGLKVIGLLLAAAIAAFLLNGFRVVQPLLQQDDFQILAQSWTWEKTWAGIWVPQNEHCMPLGRLLTWLLVRVAGRPTAVPQVTSLVGPCALLFALPLVYVFVKRELGHAFYGVLAVILFGVTAVYQQAIYWFAASYSVLALDMLLLALLAAQQHLRADSPLSAGELQNQDDAYSVRQRRRAIRWSYLGLCTALCTFAPCWFASGILVGPFCCLYLLPAQSSESFPTWQARLRTAFVRFTPMLGTVLFLAVSLPLTAKTILHLEHYEMQHTDAVAAFRPDKGFYYTNKALVENLLLGLVGVCEVPVPWWLAMFVLVPLLIAAGTWWWLRARPQDRRLMLLGVGMIYCSYVLVYSARSRWADQIEMCGEAWCRYNLVPQLGLALFFCGGLPAWQGRSFVGTTDRRRWWHRVCFALNTDGTLTGRQVVAFSVLIGISFLIQLTRGVAGAYWDYPRQHADLHRVEVLDACCRDHRIGADAARRSLLKLEIDGSLGGVNGWEFLWGSADPVERPDDEVKRLLEVCDVPKN